MRFLQFIACLFLFSGCVSSYQFTIPVAPEYYIAPADRNILIGVASNDSIEASSEIELDRDSLKEKTLIGTIERLKNLNNGTVNRLDSLVDSLAYPVASHTIDSIFKLSKATSLLLLTSLDVKTESSYGIFSNEFGRVVSGDQFFFEIHTQWRMYFKRDATFEDFNHFEYVNYDSYTSSYQILSIDKVKERMFSELVALSFLGGQAFTDKFFPQKQTIEAYLFETPKLRMANHLLRLGRTEDARKEYLSNTENASRYIQAKAYYNLAISYELKQNYPEAIRCAQKALELNPKHYLIINLNNNLPIRKQDYDTFKALGN